MRSSVKQSYSEGAVDEYRDEGGIVPERAGEGRGSLLGLDGREARGGEAARRAIFAPRTSFSFRATSGTGRGGEISTGRVDS